MVVVDSTTRAGRTLSRDALPSLAARVSVPSYDVRTMRPGVVHVGLGSFARAHVAVYLDRLAEAGVSRDWAVVGGGLRTASAGAALRRQDNLWTVTDPGTGGVRVVGVLQDYVDATVGQAALRRRLSDPDTQLVTLTVTASPYGPGARGESPALDGPGRQPFALLALALDDRRRRGLGPFTVVSCDNLPDNGAATRREVVAAAETIDPALGTWVERQVAFPSSMVDRITPCTTDIQRRALRHRHGIVDDLALVPEPFSQWVITDDFGVARPPWEEVGVQLVADVRPFVEAKSRLLNGSHVVLGYLGARHGHHTTSEAMADPRVAALVDRVMRDEVQPTLSSAVSDLAAYRCAVRVRLADQTVSDSLARLRLRGSARIAHYVVPTLRDARAAGTGCDVLVSTLAAWIDHLGSAGTSRTALAALEDPEAETLLPLAVQARHDPRLLLARTDIFGDLGADAQLVGMLRDALADLRDGSSTVAS